MPELFSQPLSRLLMHEDEKIVQEALNMWGAMSTNYSLFIEVVSGLTEYEYRDGHLDEEFLEENLADYSHKKMIISWIRNEAKRFPELNLGFSFDEAVELLRAEEHSNVAVGTTLLDPLIEDYGYLKDLLETLVEKELEEDKFGQDYLTAYFSDFPFPEHMAFWTLSKLCSFPEFKDDDSLRTINFNGVWKGGNQRVLGINELPEIECDLSFIKVFTARMNHLKELPEWFGEMDNLEELNLEHNLFREIPSQIFKLHNLRRLNLKRCLIIVIPDGIGNLKKLEELNLENLRAKRYRGGQGIKHISDKLAECVSLKRLNLIGGPYNREDLPESCRNLRW